MDVELNIRSLFEAPSVGALAKRLSAAGPGFRISRFCCRSDRPATSRRCFAIHDAGGFSWPYSKLIRHIPAEHPIFGLQARNLTQRAMRPNSVGEMAADYLNIIRKVQPVGPYNLLGWSFGGLVAHAIATQLQSMGEEVALLALLDSYPVRPENRSVGSWGATMKVLSAQVAINPIMNLLDVLRREGLTTLKEHHYEAIMDTFKNNTRIIGHLTPAIPGDLSLFRGDGLRNIGRR